MQSDWLTQLLVVRANELTAELQLLERLLSELQAPVAFLDQNMNYKLVNRMFARIVHSEVGAILGKPMINDAGNFGMFPLTDAASVAPIFEHIKNTRKPLTLKKFPVYLVEKGSQTMTFWTGTATPIFDSQGRHQGILIICSDVTDQVRFEEEYNRRLAVAESSIDAVFSVNMSGIITSWNQSAKRVYRYSPDEVIGNSVEMVVPDDKLPELHDSLVALGRGERVSAFTNRIRKGGERFPVYVSKAPVSDASNEVIGAFAITRDISERVQDAVSA